MMSFSQKEPTGRPRLSQSYLNYMRSKTPLNIHPSMWGVILPMINGFFVLPLNLNYNHLKVSNLQTITNALMGNPLQLDQNLAAEHDIDTHHINVFRSIVKVSQR